ncbi:MAG: RNA 2',3'-cyclic phosphodiesterase [Candidatus Krumholzibacteriia bacterium]
MRLFVAVNPDERFQRYLATQLDAWRQQLRVNWSRPRSWHFTLDFLGDWPAVRAVELQAALAEVAAARSPFTVTCGQVGAFPSLARARVLFLQAESGGRLEELAAAVRARVDAVWPDGPQDRKPFQAHLTFARIRTPLPSSQRPLLRQIRFAPWDPFTVDAVRLVESDLSPAGARHTDLAVLPLRG